jgi:uncharacterized phage-associated protein
MPYDALAVANAFIELGEGSHRRLTNMQLQKLVYIAHGWHLALKGEPLLYDVVQAWEWGPVIPRLYNRLKKYGAGYVTEHIKTKHQPVLPDSPEMQLLSGVWRAYGRFSGPQLSSMTHTEGTPWRDTWESHPYGEIRTEVIAKHYRQLLDERSREREKASA